MSDFMWGAAIAAVGVLLGYVLGFKEGWRFGKRAGEAFGKRAGEADGIAWSTKRLQDERQSRRAAKES